MIGMNKYIYIVINTIMIQKTKKIAKKIKKVVDNVYT